MIFCQAPPFQITKTPIAAHVALRESLNNFVDISVGCPIVAFVVDQAELCSGAN